MSWQYRIFTVERFLNSTDNLNLEEKLNKYGKEDWELTGVLQRHYATLGNQDKLEDDLIVFKKHS
ncbi:MULTISPECIES: DUF4177 domain-containing protein [Clostridium]|uniref:DUF4177 domain-containing protein n=6 Tax=Clostridium TaxID=1485 RepID=A0A166SJ15_9CLOT|nr:MULTISPECIES: DUF4177 domain-containing protein [Clostridium]ADK17067.1 hypothetical protein CLJU_c40430 [Clostridium ljungdahlii DSM 13528]AGY76105.1 DUF4177 domain-containing protein [Clostridium autoethanogenum DSM 10061]ALU36267.1 hypothetical protein CLAU_1838 [Clostridium autoethanogenum DSM 10061]AZV58693.1 DUF4177 domain-containing protein [Clostridium sp. AWRP]OAA85167.1 hypothetical protein WX45_00671 [Clostridium ljungdahlii DSM 13528]